jgi:hypothetical protein
MLNQDLIVAIRTLLGRVQLSGNEVPAFNKIMMALAAEENEGKLKTGPQSVVGGSADAKAA